MKLGILFILVLSLFHTAAFGDMSVTDLEKIRDITKDSETRVRAEITAVEKRLKAEIDAAEERLSQEIVASEERSKEFTSHETAKVGVSVNAVKEQLNWNFLLVLALIGLFGVILGLRTPVCLLISRQTAVYTLAREVELANPGVIQRGEQGLRA